MVIQFLLEVVRGRPLRRVRRALLVGLPLLLLLLAGFPFGAALAQASSPSLAAPFRGPARVAFRR